MIDKNKAGEIIDHYRKLRGGLLECLHGLQSAFGFVPEETIDLIADGFNISRAEVHGVISYYHDFRRKPNGKTVVKVCQAESCQAMGSRALSAHIAKKLGLDIGHSNKDYTLEAVYCFGNCALSPNVEINGRLHARVSRDNFDKLIGKEGAV